MSIIVSIPAQKVRRSFPMQDHPSRRLLSPAAIASFAALLIATGSGVAWWTWKQESTKPIPNALEHAQPQDPNNLSQTHDSTQPQVPPATVTPVPVDQTLQVYWLKAADNKIQLVPSPVKLTSSSTPEALLGSAMQQLVAGSPQTDLSSTVPANTKVLNLAIKPDGIHINLSREFTMGGGSSSMEGRLAQVLYTATSLNPHAAVWLSVEGKPLTMLGGEGLVVPQPVTRKQFEKDFPM
jgi:spore germination protein GerM